MATKVIYKYSLYLIPDQGQGVTMPTGAEILTVQMQGETPVLWAIVDPLQPVSIRTIEMLFTGAAIYEHPASELKYISTMQHDGLVFHVFERIM